MLSTATLSFLDVCCYVTDAKVITHARVITYMRVWYFYTNIIRDGTILESIMSVMLAGKLVPRFRDDKYNSPIF